MQEKVRKHRRWPPKQDTWSIRPTNDTASLLSDFFGMLFAIGLAAR